MIANPLLRRRSGILLHPTSLPSRRLDDDALRWLDFLASAGQGVWQVLPLGMPCRGYSPYQCLSAFAANPALLPLDSELLPRPDDPHYREWLRQQAFWLEDFASFLLLKQLHDGKPWYEWPDPYRHRHPGVLHTLQQKHAHRIELIRWQQYQIYRSWHAIRTAAGARDIQLFGDMPIFVAHDSADVWAAPERFLLDGQGQLASVTGVPPDYFSATGQRWGNPHYDWKRLEDEGFEWWLKRLQTHFQWFDLLRIDHFRGLEAVWMIDPACPTAERGEWVSTPGAALLLKLQQRMGDLPLVAEDLGVITPAVTELRKRFKLPGMAVLQFAFDAFEDNPHKPRNITPDTVVYTGTHDNDTTLGWFSSLQPHEQRFVLDNLGISDPAGVVDAMMNAAMQSRAQLCILPLQDVLGLDSRARMNRPGDDGEHWRWRFDWPQITPEIVKHLREMSRNAKRS
jgi:4-alpha-glucanotransferase